MALKGFTRIMSKTVDSSTYPEWINTGKKSCLNYAKERMEKILATHKPIPLTPSQEEDIERILEEEMASHRKSMKSPIHTFTNWRQKILNYFDYRIINSFVEGKNNRIKTIKMIAYGYCNMDNFRLRILATNPGCEDKRVCVLI